MLFACAGERSQARAAAAKDDGFASSGGDGEAKGYVGESMRVIHARGRVPTPGRADNHRRDPVQPGGYAPSCLPLGYEGFGGAPVRGISQPLQR